MATSRKQQNETIEKSVRASISKAETKREKAARISREAKEAKALPLDEGIDRELLPTVEEYEEKKAAKLVATIDRILGALHELGVQHPIETAKRVSTGGPRERSQIDGPVNIVWEICTRMLITSNTGGYSRKHVLHACVEAGVNINTARTQIQRCLTARGIR